MGTAMFPLGAVLFPHTPLALRIFEERYLVMLGRLLDETDPAFGVVLIERGSETGGGDQRFPLGTMAQLSHVVPQAGQMQVVARGTERFEIVEWLDDDPYPRADVRALPDLEWNEALLPLLEEAERIVRRVLGRAQQFGGTRWDPEVELAEEPLPRAWQVAAIAPLGELDQMELLRSVTLGGLLRATIDLTLAAEPLLGDPVPDGVIVVDDEAPDDED
ncbi:LON peptidase substrate-binding domain-containing protein [Microbacterium sp. PRF11]|uniref:LON peptidase substrate-binding domain-containing protein n=1 Tax=Microbacterium sp. PRF11 TaxID=2962593 RepID=UPI002881B1BA|nr:LON peptidase substrate-binding domain-containing protein [Microbacterium sp. PRF11]MDT0115399.1 LON peptidase substrate-binding domain-containing protein [Microbacterium sp. PRF11]